MAAITHGGSGADGSGSPTLPAGDPSAFIAAFRARYGSGYDRARTLALLQHATRSYEEYIGLSHDELVARLIPEFNDFDARLDRGEVPHLFDERMSRLLGATIESTVATAGARYNIDLSALAREEYDLIAEAYFEGQRLEDQLRSHEEKYLLNMTLPTPVEEGILQTYVARAAKDQGYERLILTLFPDLPPAQTAAAFESIREIFAAPVPGLPDLSTLSLSPEIVSGQQPDGAITVSPEQLQIALANWWATTKKYISEHLVPAAATASNASPELSGRERSLKERLQRDAADEAARKERERGLLAVETGLKLITSLVGKVDKRAASELSTFSTSAMQIARSLNSFAGGGALGAVIGVTNILGALVSLTSLLEPSKPPPEAMIIKGIKDLREQIARLDTAIQARMDRLENTMSAVWRDMLTEFGELKLQVGQVEQDVHVVQQRLVEAADRVRALNADLMDALAGLQKSQLETTLNEILGWRSQVHHDLDFDTWKGHENVLQLWSTTTCYDMLQVGEVNEGGPLEAFEELGARARPQPARHIGYLSQWMCMEGIGFVDESEPYGFVRPEERIANPAVWAAAARAYATMRVDWPEHAGLLRSTRTDPVKEAGQTLRSALERLTRTRAIWVGESGLLQRYQHYAAPLADEVRTKMLTWWAAQERSKFDLWGPVGQDVSDVAPPAPPVLTLPDASHVETPNSLRIGIGMQDQDARFYVYLFSREARSLAVRLTTTTGWEALRYQDGKEPTGEIKPPYRWYRDWYATPSVDIEVHLAVESTEPRPGPGPGPDPDPEPLAIGAREPDATEAAGVSWIRVQTLHVHGNETFRGRTALNESAPQRDSAPWVRAQWDTIRGRVDSGEVSWGAPMSATDRARIRESARQLVADVRRKALNAAADELEFGALEVRSRALSGMRAVIQCSVELGFPAALARDDVLRLLLYGREGLSGRFELGAILRSLPPGEEPWNDLRDEVELRRNYLERLLAAYLDAVIQGQYDETYPLIDTTLLLLRLADLAAPAWDLRSTPWRGGLSPVGRWQNARQPGLIYTDIDTRSGSFEATPLYFANLRIPRGAPTASGPCVVGLRTPTGFRFSVMDEARKLTAAEAEQKGWRVQWFGVEDYRSRVGTAPPEATSWQQTRRAGELVATVPTGGAWLRGAPAHVITMSGQGRLDAAGGTLMVDRPTRTGFRVYLRGNDRLTPEWVINRGISMQWFAMELGRYSGATERGNTAWRRGSRPGHIYVDLDTTGLSFAATPLYFATVCARTSSAGALGLSYISQPTPNRFRFHLLDRSGALTPKSANDDGLQVRWLGVERTR